jgi:gamma-glutamyl phosphate reductase
MDYTAYFEKAKQASQNLASLSKTKIDAVLVTVASALIQQKDAIIAANEQDLKP